jgi:XTP/dITP diphosphohydrolase
MATRATELRFVSSNHHKISEATGILGASSIRVVPSSLKIEELQTQDTQKLIRDKVLKAFKEIGRPLFVEHTGLYLEHLGGFPGGLTQVFWDTIEADRFAELFGRLAASNKAKARTAIAYCDGRNIYHFDGEIDGIIADLPRGPRHFQWDCVFQPEGHAQTFAEMGSAKNDISMRKIALAKLVRHLTGTTP